MDKNSAILIKIENGLANSPKLDKIVTLFNSLLSLSKIGSPISILLSDNRWLYIKFLSGQWYLARIFTHFAYWLSISVSSHIPPSF
jgi:hypothetical protein